MLLHVELEPLHLLGVELLALGHGLVVGVGGGADVRVAVVCRGTLRGSDGGHEALAPWEGFDVADDEHVVISLHVDPVLGADGYRVNGGLVDGLPILAPDVVLLFHAMNSCGGMPGLGGFVRDFHDLWSHFSRDSIDLHVEDYGTDPGPLLAGPWHDGLTNLLFGEPQLLEHGLAGVLREVSLRVVPLDEKFGTADDALEKDSASLTVANRGLTEAARGLCDAIESAAEEHSRLRSFCCFCYCGRSCFGSRLALPRTEDDCCCNEKRGSDESNREKDRYDERLQCS